MAMGLAAVVVILAGSARRRRPDQPVPHGLCHHGGGRSSSDLADQTRARPIWAFLITVVATVVGIGLVIVVLTSSINQFIGDLPQYKDEFAELQSQVTEALTSLGLSTSTVESSPVDTSDLAEAVAGVASWLVSAFTNFGFMLGLAAFMLFEATAMPAR